MGENRMCRYGMGMVWEKSIVSDHGLGKKTGIWDQARELVSLQRAKGEKGDSMPSIRAQAKRAGAVYVH